MTDTTTAAQPAADRASRPHGETATEHSYGWDLLASLPKGTELHTVVRHASSSGMTRWITVHAVQDGRIVNVSVPEAGFRMHTRGHDGYEVGGCGMDMGFHLVYSLGQAVHGDGYYFTQRWL
jgi:hypothetical protein